jgi:hypothetical protein
MGRWAGYWMLDDASDGKTRRHPYLYNEIFASLCRVNRRHSRRTENILFRISSFPKLFRGSQCRG